MAKYDVNYACGHGCYTEHLFGPTAGRDSRIEWLEANRVCPDCYRAKKHAEDAVAKKTAKICLVPSSDPIISIDVYGQIEANKQSLARLGYKWHDSHADGLLGVFSMSRPKRALSLICNVDTIEQLGAWLTEQQANLAALGYEIVDNLSPVDMAYLAKLLREKKEAKKRLAEIEASDPRPAMSPLRARIAEIEKSSGAKWNGKIYGFKGSYNFYVNDVKYTASDAEVADGVKAGAALQSWTDKYKKEIDAAK